MTGRRQQLGSNRKTCYLRPADPRHGEPADPRHGELAEPRHGEPVDRHGEPVEPQKRSKGL